MLLLDISSSINLSGFPFEPEEIGMALSSTGYRDPEDALSC